MDSRVVDRQLSLSLYSSSLPYRLDSLTLAVVIWFTHGLYRKIEHRLQTYIINIYNKHI